MDRTIYQKRRMDGFDQKGWTGVELKTGFNCTSLVPVNNAVFLHQRK